MAWIGAVAAAACAQDGRRRKKPSKLVFLITILSLVMGLFVPLVIILGMYEDSSMTIFPLIFMFIIMIGLIVLVAAGFTETLDEDGTLDDSSDRYERYKRERTSYHARPRTKKGFYSTNEYYWGSEPRSSSFFCTNCGNHLEPNDRFCDSCGWRVN
ncbi:MAG: zinc ribbon domain-containing protein [Candidatus Thorarchaeota archaeon]